MGDPRPATPIPPSPAPTTGARRAVIDVGTNSVKLLVGAVDGAQVTPLVERSRQTRLGEGLFDTRRLQPEAIARTAETVAEFAGVARQYAPATLSVIATAAARESENAAELGEAIRAASGLAMRVIDGETEADWSFQGVGTGAEGHGGAVLVTDLGGGSTEFVLGRDGRRLYARSHPLGANRLLARLSPGDPPGEGALRHCRAELDAFFAREILPELDGARHRHHLPSPDYRAVGGSAVILARLRLGMEGFDREAIEACRIRRDELEELTLRLWSVPLAERRNLVGLPPERADIMLTGSAIHEGILRNLQLDSFRPSTRGLRFAALLQPT